MRDMANCFCQSIQLTYDSVLYCDAIDDSFASIDYTLSDSNIYCATRTRIEMRDLIPGTCRLYIIRLHNETPIFFVKAYFIRWKFSRFRAHFLGIEYQ